MNVLRIDPATLDDAGWLCVADEVAVGRSVRLQRIHPKALTRLFSLGFWRESREHWRRVFDWRAPLPLIPCDVPGVPLGAIVVASVARPRDAQETPYLYGTLRSLFASMPDGIEINVFVGGHNADYASAIRLADALGEQQARRVHVVAANRLEASFLARHASVRARTTWNHMRALRSYQQGEGRLLFLEDDIAWSRYATRLVLGASFLEEPEFISLYHGEQFDWWCSRETPCQREYLEVRRGGTQSLGFSCCQALLYTASLARRVADVLSLRLEPYPVDTTMGRYFDRIRPLMGWARPAPVQHVGVATTVQRPFHQAACFVADDTSGESAQALWPQPTSID